MNNESINFILQDIRLNTQLSKSSTLSTLPSNSLKMIINFNIFLLSLNLLEQIMRLDRRSLHHQQLSKLVSLIIIIVYFQNILY